LSAISELELRLGAHWPNLHQASNNAQAKLAAFTEAVKDVTASDASVVVFGSLARFELTSGSDIDWTLLLDGPSDPQHHHVSQKIASAVKDLTKKDVGQEGTFGSLVSSHDLVNDIGGEGDTNSNTTRRNLLLLESRSIGNDEAYTRVKKNLLKRYLSEDSGLWREEVKNKLPHFLLNDIARYWRTMTVDYAYKERTRGGSGIPLRNIKLGLSRKLIFVAGLLACYTCHLDFEDDLARERFYSQQNTAGLVAKLHETLKMFPLELVASILGRFTEHAAATKQLFDTYDRFLGLLLNEDTRKHLERLHSDDCSEDAFYQDAKSLKRDFQRALSEIFLEKTSLLGRFTIRYGVF
jgi:predicted nucleotidyltransferase